MVMDEEEVREMCVRLAEDCFRMVGVITKLEEEKLQLNVDLNTVEDSNVDLQVQLTEMHNEKELLKDYVDNMCGMIEAETPLKEHDRWLKDCREMGWYPNKNTIDAEFEEVEEDDEI